MRVGSREARIVRDVLVAVIGLAVCVGLGGVADAAGPKSIEVTCPGDDLQAALDEAKNGDKIEATGTCTGHFAIARDGIKLRASTLPILDPGANDVVLSDSDFSATLMGPDGSAPTLLITGQGVSVRGLKISGGAQGVWVGADGSATITDNWITGAIRVGSGGGQGIIINRRSFAEIQHNMIDANAWTGIEVLRTSYANIDSNNILTNDRGGVGVFWGASADIDDNQIKGNGDDGGTNGRHGVRVGWNSHVNVERNTFFGNTDGEFNCFFSGSYAGSGNSFDVGPTARNPNTVGAAC